MSFHLAKTRVASPQMLSQRGLQFLSVQICPDDNDDDPSVDIRSFWSLVGVVSVANAL